MSINFKAFLVIFLKYWILFAQTVLISEIIKSKELILTVADSIDVEELEIHLVFCESSCFVGQNKFNLPQIIVDTGSLNFSIEFSVFAFLIPFKQLALGIPDNFQTNQQRNGNKIGKTDKPTSPGENGIYKILFSFIEVRVLIMVSGQDNTVRSCTNLDHIYLMRVTQSWKMKMYRK